MGHADDNMARRPARLIVASRDEWASIELCPKIGEYVYMTAKTDAQRKADERARKRLEGITEVRGIWAHHDLHKAIKQAVLEIQAKLQRREKRKSDQQGE